MNSKYRHLDSWLGWLFWLKRWTITQNGSMFTTRSKWPFHLTMSMVFRPEIFAWLLSWIRLFLLPSNNKDCFCNDTMIWRFFISHYKSHLITKFSLFCFLFYLLCYLDILQKCMSHILNCTALDKWTGWTFLNYKKLIKKIEHTQFFKWCILVHSSS